MALSAQTRPRSSGHALTATIAASVVAVALVALGVGTARRTSGSTVLSEGTDASARTMAIPGATPDEPRAHREVIETTAAGRSEIRPDARGLDLALLGMLRPSRFGRSCALGVDSGGRWPIRALAVLPSSAQSPDVAPYDDASIGGLRTIATPHRLAFYNGRPIRAIGTMRMKVTAYSPDFRSCGASADGITASGYSVLTNGGCMVAADPRVLPLGSLVSVPGYDDGAVVPVLDTGGAIKGHRLDVLYPTHEVAMRWGVQEVDVIVWDYADGLPNGFRRLRRP